MLGDGEQAVLAITGHIRDWKRAGRPGGRDGLLAALAADGVYVPRFYDVDYLPDGRIQRVVPNRPDVPFRVRKRTTGTLVAGLRHHDQADENRRRRAQNRGNDKMRRRIRDQRRQQCGIEHQHGAGDPRHAAGHHQE